MNKHCYKIIFSQALNCPVVVSEGAKSNGKSDNRSFINFPATLIKHAEGYFALHRLASTILISLGLISLSSPVAAQIVADEHSPNGKKPAILTTDSGITKVDINAPTAAGVSVNHYSQFNVEKRGAILSNNRKTVPAHIAGWVAPNPNMARGEADVIVNQVNDSHESLLNGYVEVAGKRADVIIANPNGININGGGFLNASKVTLSTGQTQFKEGQLTGHSVSQGQLTVSGKGLDIRDTDYTELLSRSAAINAKIYQEEGQLNIITGTNDIDSQGNIVGKNTGKGQKPKIAIDVGKLGGMYANSIHIVANESGVGVNNAGKIQSTKFQLTTDGKLTNRGEIVATQALTLAAGDFTNSGKILTTDILKINAADTKNSGKINAEQLDITLKNLNNSGVISQVGNQPLSLNAYTMHNRGEIGKGTEPQSAPNKANQATETKSSSPAISGQINIDDRLANSGLINAMGKVDIDVSSSLTNKGQIAINELSTAGRELANYKNIHAEKLTSAAQNVVNSGYIIADSATLSGKSLDNGRATLTGSSKLQINMKRSVSNIQGEFLSEKGIAINAPTLNNNRGKIQSKTRTSINVSDHINNKKGQIYGREANLSFNTLNNSSGGKITAKTKATLAGKKTLNNNQGEIIAGKLLTIHDDKQLSLSNSNGKILSPSVSINAESLFGIGDMTGARDIDIRLKGDLHAEKDLIVNGKLTLTMPGELTNAARLSGGESTQIEAKRISNKASGKIVGDEATIIKTENLTNRGLINSNGLTHLIVTHDIKNIGGGRIYGNNIALESSTLHSQKENKKSAVIAAREHLAIGAQVIDNQADTELLSEGTLTIGSALKGLQSVGEARTLTNNGGLIQAKKDMLLSVGTLNNLNAELITEKYKTSPRKVIEAAVNGTSKRYNINNVCSKGGNTCLSYDSQNQKHATLKGTNITAEHWDIWDYMKTVHTHRIVSSKSGRIFAGGNLIVSGKDWLNYDSQIMAGGTLDEKALDNITNDGKKFLESIDVDGEYVLSSWRRSWYSGGKRPRRKEKNRSIYTNVGDNPTAPKMEEYKTLSLDRFEGNVGGIPSVTGIGTLSLPTSPLFTVDINDPNVLFKVDKDFLGDGKLSMENWEKLGFDASAPYLPAAFQELLQEHNMHKRIGDGYYEQRLIQQQLANLTGRRFSEGYSNDLEQYKGLLNSGAEFMKKYQLKPGVALTAEQMKNLTTDLVLLESQEITLADGSKQQVTVPKVYAKHRDYHSELKEGLISARNVNFKSGKSFINNAAILADNLDIHMNTQRNDGVIIGKKVRQIASGNIYQTGKTFAKDSLFMLGENVIIEGSSSVDKNGRKKVHHQAVISVGGGKANSNFTLLARKDMDLNAVSISNTGKGKNAIVAGNNLNIGTLGHESAEDIAIDDRNYRHEKSLKQIGSNINVKGDLQLQAGNQLTVTQGQIDSEQGQLTGIAKNIVVNAGVSEASVSSGIYHKEKGMISSSSLFNQSGERLTQSTASSLTGKKVQLRADENIKIHGSHVVSDNGTLLYAGKDIDITAAKNVHDNYREQNESESGLLSSGGIGFTIGKQSTTTDSDTATVIHQGSMVGNLKEGNTTIVAGGTYTQEGSAVNSVLGNVNVLAKHIHIKEVEDKNVDNNKSIFEKSGLTVALSVPAIDAVMGATKSAKNIGKSKNSRVNAMAVANTAAQTYQAAGDAQALSNGNPQGVKISITYGEQKNISESHIKHNSAKASTMRAGGKVNLIATGGDKSSILISGSDVAGSKATSLYADHDVTIKASAHEGSERSQNRSAGWNAGVAIAFNNGVSFGVTAGGNKGKGHGNGDDLTHRHAHVGSLTGTTTITAGNKLTLKGGQAIGKGVKVSAKELEIESLQDSSTYASKQKNMSAEVTVGFGFSGSGSFSKSKTKANHLAVKEQSGIFAGDDGFDVNITNHTAEKGGIITSTAKAEAEGKNRFSTGTISTSDLQNHSEYKAKGFGIGGGISISGKDLGQGEASDNPHLQNISDKTGVSKSVGYGRDKDKQNSITRSGIGTKNITITDSGKQANIQPDLLNTDNLTIDITSAEVLANQGLTNRFDKGKVQDEIDLQVGVTQEFDRTRQSVKQKLNNKIDALKEKVKQGQASQEELDNFKKVDLLVDGIGGALYTPNANGIIGDVAQVASPHLAKQIGDYFAKNGESKAAHGLAHTVLAAAVAASA